jgi:hypothetical protein
MNMADAIDETKPTYPVDTLADMARIPLEALPRFLAELPALLDVVRSNPLFEHLGKGVTLGAVWVDDDAGLVRETMSFREAEDAPVSIRIEHTRPIKASA